LEKRQETMVLTATTKDLEKMGLSIGNQKKIMALISSVNQREQEKQLRLRKMKKQGIFAFWQPFFISFFLSFFLFAFSS